MTNVTDAAQSLDVVSLGTNLGILLGFIVAAILGLKRGLKLIDKTETPAKSGTGLSLVESQTLLFWTDSNRAVAEALADVKSASDLLREALLAHAALTAATQREMSELRHEIELLRSQLK